MNSFQYAAAQTTSTCVADFSTLTAIIANLNKTYYTAVNYTIPKPPLVIPDVNTNRGSIDALNDMAYQWSYSTANATAILMQVFANFSKAVTDNKTADYPGIFDNVTAAIAAAIGTDGSGPIFSGLSGIPGYAQQTYVYLINNFTNFFNSSGILIGSAEGLVSILNSSGAAVTPANVSKNLMAPSAVAIFLSGLTNLTNLYMGFVTNVTRDMNNTYTIYKSNDATLKDITLNANYTINNLTQLVTLINATVYNNTYSTLVGFNSSIAKFIAANKDSVKSNSDFTGNMTAIYTIMASLADYFYNGLIPSISSNLQSYLGTMNTSLQSAYSNLTLEFPSPYRQYIFQAFNNTGGNNNCSYNLTTNAEKTFAAFGGSKAFFNCSGYEKVVLNETQSVVNGTITAINMAFNTHMALFNSCLTLGQSLPNGVNISTLDCISLVSCKNIFNSYFVMY